MKNTWVIVIAAAIFLIITFLYWKMTSGYAENEYGKKMWQQWGTKTFYWSGAFFIRGGITVMVIFLLKWANILTF
ncbi:hypothetical protein [Algibacter sp. 2305UL17-15]|uniref:hypothetical protein n=1 Tax=Algibacter sp. 2305UL17-15 TaxID=3231268 RepID=UPI00345A4F01